MLFVVLAGLPVFWADAQIPAFRRYSLREGLPQSEITAMHQDMQGYVWIGTKGGGLVQYDGYNFQIYNKKQNLSNNFISDIGEEDGKLTILSAYGCIDRFDQNHFTGYQRHSDFDVELKRMVRVHGLYYVLTNKNIAEENLKTGKPRIIYNFSKENNWFGDVSVAGNRWIAAAVDSGLLIIDTRLPSRSILMQTATHLKGRKVAGINPLSESELALISNTGETATLHFTDGWPMPLNWHPQSGIQLKENEHITQVVFGLGHVVKWYATNQKRVKSASGEVLDFTVLPHEKIQHISALMLDRNGSLWIGTEGSGLIIKPANSIFNYNNFTALRSGELRAVYHTKDGKILAGGKATGLLVANLHNLASQNKVLTGQSIHSIQENGLGYLIGCGNGVRLLDKKTFRQLAYFPQPGRTAIIKPQANGDVLLGTYGNGLWKLTSAMEMVKIPADPGLSYVYGIENTTNEGVIIASNNHLWQLDTNSRKLLQLATPPTVGTIFFLSTKDSHGNLWFSTPEAIVCRHRNGWRRYTVEHGLSSPLIYTLNADKYGHIWAGSNLGIDRLTADESGRVLDIKNFGPAEGYDGYEANMLGSYMDDNQLFVCTIEGLFGIPVKNKSLDPLPTIPFISSLKVNTKGSEWKAEESKDSLNRFLLPPQNHKIAHSPKGVAFTFAAINPFHPDRLLYSYKLEGADESWSQPSKNREAYFIDLKSGKYTFLVRTSYNGFSFSTPARYTFFVQSAWYENYWLTVFGTVLAAILCMVVIRIVYQGLYIRTLINKDSITPERTSQFLLFVASVFIPSSLIISRQSGTHIEFNNLLLTGVSGISFLLFLLTTLGTSLKRRSFSFLQGVFVLYMVYLGTELVSTQMSPYYVVKVIYVSAISYLVLNRLWQIITFISILLLFAVWSNFYFDGAHFSPLPFLVACTLVSTVLLVTFLMRQRTDERVQFFDTVVNTGHVLVLGFETNGGLAFSSDNIYSLLGYGSWEVKGFSWWSQVINPAGDSVEMLRMIQQKEEGTLKARVKCKSGEVRTFQFTGRSINQNLKVMIGQDITDAHFLEAKFENLVENAPDCIYQTDFYGKMIYANPQTAYLLGVSHEELIGKHFSEFIREDQREEVLAFYHDQFERRNSSTYLEFPVLTRTGNTRWLSFQVSLLYRSDGETIDGYLAIGRDVTDRLEAEQLIQHQHKNITDSLSYASRIKKALLPGEAELKEVFTQVATINRPKDIIGGDFYWLTRIGRKQFLVVGDCTGHGVPGAFMTMITVGILRQVIRDGSTRGVEEILSVFNKTLSKVLKSNAESENNDFVELAVCMIDEETNTMDFISSGLGLHLLRKGEIITYQNGSRGLVYSFDYRNQAAHIQIDPDDRFFIFTDGMFDQIGGPFQKRYTRKKLLGNMVSRHHQPLVNLVAEIESGFQAWKGDTPQIDDCLLIGFRV